MYSEHFMFVITELDRIWKRFTVETKLAAVLTIEASTVVCDDCKALLNVLNINTLKRIINRKNADLQTFSNWNYSIHLMSIHIGQGIAWDPNGSWKTRILTLIYLIWLANFKMGNWNEVEILFDRFWNLVTKSNNDITTLKIKSELAGNSGRGGKDPGKECFERSSLNGRQHPQIR